MSFALFEQSAIPTGGRTWTYRVGYHAYVPVWLTVSFDGAPPVTVRVDAAEPCWFAVAGLDALTIRSATASLSDGAHSTSFPEVVVPHIDVAEPIAATSIADAVSYLFGRADPQPVRLAVSYQGVPVLLIADAVPDPAEIENAIRQWAAATDAPRDGDFVFDITYPPTLRFRHISVPFGALIPEMTPQTERL